MYMRVIAKELPTQKFLHYFLIILKTKTKWLLMKQDKKQNINNTFLKY